MPKKNKSPKVNAQDYIKVNAHEKWLQMSSEKTINQKDFFRIVKFYVLHSPCKESSYSPNTIDELGWKKGAWKSSRFRDAFDSIPGFVEDENFMMHDSKNHFLEMWEQASIKDFPDNTGKEYAIFTHAGESNPRLDLLHHIRNAFAHGRFSIIIKGRGREPFFFFEDVSTIPGISGIVVVARVCLKISTLLGWIDLFERKSDVAKKLSSLFAE